MFRKIESNSQPLTLELAKEFVALKPVPGERELRPPRLHYLAVQLRDGTFGGPNWSRGIDRETGQLYRLDGQHSSNLLADLPSGLTFPEGLLVTIDTYEFDLVEDTAAVFDLFNHPKSARTSEDAMGIYRARIPAFADLERNFLLKVANGIAEYEKTQEQGVLYEPRKRGLYFTHYPKFEKFAIWCEEFNSYKNDDFLNKAVIVAEMCHHFLLDQPRATEFWRLVFSENHPEVDHETRILAQTFREWSMVPKKYRPDQYRSRSKTAWKHYLREVGQSAQPVLT